MLKKFRPQVLTKVYFPAISQLILEMVERIFSVETFNKRAIDSSCKPLSYNPFTNSWNSITFSALVVLNIR
ncbi:MAG: hypothetical protein PHZ01_07980, partial [Bacteroidales bacterium]|nr:hypothetical protein [Bacteroidales bacterium]